MLFGNKSVLFFTGLLLLSLFFVTFSTSQNLQNSTEKNKKPIATLNGVKYFQIKEEKTSIEVSANSAERYEDFDKITVVTIKKDEKLLETATAKEAILKNGTIILSGGVGYLRSDGLSAEITDGTYNTKNSVFETKSVFKINSPKYKAEGTSMIYDKKDSTIEAKEIQIRYKL